MEKTKKKKEIEICEENQIDRLILVLWFHHIFTSELSYNICAHGGADLHIGDIVLFVVTTVA